MGGLHGCRRMTHVCSSRTLRRWLGGADGSLSADSPETDDTALPPPPLQEPCEWTAECATVASELIPMPEGHEVSWTSC